MAHRVIVGLREMAEASVARRGWCDPLSAPGALIARDKQPVLVDAESTEIAAATMHGR